MFDFFFFIFLLFFGAVWLYQKWGEKELDKKIKRAWQNHDYLNYPILIEEKRKKFQEREVAKRQATQDHKYLDALITLDAAEHGIFLPRDEEVFNTLDEEPHVDDLENDYRMEEPED